MDALQTTRASLRDFLHVVFKRKTQILLFFATIVLTVAIGTPLVSKKYDLKFTRTLEEHRAKLEYFFDSHTRGLNT